MRLAVHCDGRIVVTVPARFDDHTVVERYIMDKKQWLMDKMHFFNSVDSALMRVFSEDDYLKNKDAAFCLVEKRVKAFNKTLGFQYNKIIIKDFKTKWGSCSKKKNLHFNYKLIFLPKKQQDYIIIHELCHVKECSHSRKFWALVEKIMPDYLSIKNDLRNHELFYK